MSEFNDPDLKKLYEKLIALELYVKQNSVDIRWLKTGFQTINKRIWSIIIAEIGILIAIISAILRVGI